MFVGVRLNRFFTAARQVAFLRFPTIKMEVQYNCNVLLSFIIFA